MKDKEFKYGVYMKSSGHLVHVYKGDKRRYEVMDGRVNTNPLVRAFYPKPSQRMLVLEADSLGWGCTTYMNKAEYLGEL